MPPYLCPCCSSLLNVFPFYYPHLSLCHSLRHRSNIIYIMEFTLTSRMSSSLYELPGTPYLPWVILHCPHLDWGHPEGRHVAALGDPGPQQAPVSAE